MHHLIQFQLQISSTEDNRGIIPINSVLHTFLNIHQYLFTAEPSRNHVFFHLRPKAHHIIDNICSACSLNKGFGLIEHQKMHQIKSNSGRTDYML